MAYIKTVWAVDTEITASLLNHMEEQYAEAVSIIGTHDHDSDYYRKAETDQKYYHANNMGAGSGADADTIRGLGPEEFEGIGAPAGFICMFGGFGSVPDGWYLCDGGNGTPDMRDRFVVGAGGELAVNATGGAASVTPSAVPTISLHAVTVAQLPTDHTHPYTDQYTAPGVSIYDMYNMYAVYGWHSSVGSLVDHSGYYTGYTGGGEGHGHPGSTWTGDAQENRPPYFALRFIMKE